MLKIPLFANPYYDFYTALENESYHITVKWNSLDSCWHMDLEGVNNSVDLKGIRLVGGVNLLEPFAVLELNALYVVDLHEKYEDPNFDDIGTRFQLLYLEKGETL